MIKQTEILKFSMQEMPGAGMEAGQAARRNGEACGGKKSYKERVKPG